MNSSILKILNKAIKETNGNEFKVLYYILNGKALGVAKFFKDVLADELNITPRQIALITDSLVKKGYITKERSNNGRIYYFKPQTEKRETSKKVLTLKEQYHQQLEHPMWKKKREEVFERYGKQCVECGKTNNLQVHHLVYRKERNAWEYNVDELIPLCKKCHEKVHKDKNHKFHEKYIN